MLPNRIPEYFNTLRTKEKRQEHKCSCLPLTGYAFLQYSPPPAQYSQSDGFQSPHSQVFAESLGKYVCKRRPSLSSANNSHGKLSVSSAYAWIIPDVKPFLPISIADTAAGLMPSLWAIFLKETPAVSRATPKRFLVVSSRGFSAKCRGLGFFPNFFLLSGFQPDQNRKTLHHNNIRVLEYMRCFKIKSGFL